MADREVDLFVVGAGSGGVRAARIAAGYGARVMVAEEFRVGGTCAIRGRVPKKLLVYAARYADEFEDAGGYGWTVGEPVFEWTKLIANKDREIVGWRPPMPRRWSGPRSRWSEPWRARGCPHRSRACER